MADTVARNKVSSKNNKRSDLKVQGTNDSSIVSKCSTASCGYFDEPFLHYFIPKVSRRAPLIHRGYYIRGKAFEIVLNHFLAQHAGTTNQIISLGCGFDSTYFRLKAAGLLGNTTFYEVDFPDLVRRKRLIIENTEDLSAWIVKNSQEPLSPHLELSCTDYHLLGIDLTQLNTLEAALKMSGLDFDTPTLLFSECVMTYMTRRCSTDLVKWAAETLEDAVFVMYEQIHPDDAFGLFMQNHFYSIGCPLKCINAFPTLESQIKRFQKSGWTWCEAIDMNQFYYQCLSQEERHRVDKLESFDEYEELNLKYSHYFILTASTLSPTDSLITGRQSTTATSLPPALHDVLSLTWPISLPPPQVRTGSKQTTSQTSQEPSVHRFGHTTCTVDGRYAVTAGGFGETDGRHQRLTEVTVTDLTTMASYHVACGSPNLQYPRMHHAAVALSNGTVYLIGGRQSPYYLCDQILQLRICASSKHALSKESRTLPETCSGDSTTVSKLQQESPGDIVNVDLCDIPLEKSTGADICSKDAVSNIHSTISHGLSSTCDFPSKNGISLSNSTCSSANENGQSLSNELSSQSKQGEEQVTEKKTLISESNPSSQKIADSLHSISAQTEIEQTGDAPCQRWPFELGHLEVSVVEHTPTSASQRWRHAATVVHLEDRELIFVHGGKTKGGTVLEDCYLFDPTQETWEQLSCSGDVPGPVHSHSLCWYNGQVILTGGLNIEHVPLDTVYALDLINRVWRKLDIGGQLYPRYSHTSHVIGHRLVLVGGVNQFFPPPGVATINMDSEKAMEFALPAADKSNLLMFHRHSSLLWGKNCIVIFGGGGNCFSFGTHLNHSPVIMDITKCLQAVE